MNLFSIFMFLHIGQIMRLRHKKYDQLVGFMIKSSRSNFRIRRLTDFWK